MFVGLLLLLYFWQLAAAEWLCMLLASFRWMSQWLTSRANRQALHLQIPRHCGELINILSYIF